MPLRSPCDTLCVVVAIIHPCNDDSTRLAAYIIINVVPISATADMSMPPINPFCSMSVRSDILLGPISVSTVPAIAQIIATANTA